MLEFRFGNNNQNIDFSLFKNTLSLSELKNNDTLKQIFSLFDTDNNGVLEISNHNGENEIGNLLNGMYSYASSNGNSVFEEDEIQSYLNSTVNSDGQSLSDKKVTVNDILSFLNILSVDTKALNEEVQDALEENENPGIEENAVYVIANNAKVEPPSSLSDNNRRIITPQLLPLNQKGPYTIEHCKEFIAECEAYGIPCEDIKSLLEYTENNCYNSRITARYVRYYINKLNKRIENYNKPREDFPNEKFQKNIKQGAIGDCWFLSTVISLSQNPANRAKLENLISFDNPNNPKTITVNFKGAEPFTVSIEALKAANEFSSGNLYVRALEMAAEHYLITQSNAIDILKVAAPEKDNAVKSPFEGGTANYALSILFGEETTQFDYIDRSMLEQLPDIYERNNESSADYIKAIYAYLGIKDISYPEEPYEHYHDPKVIQEALNSGKVVTVYTSSLINGEKLQNQLKEEKIATDHVRAIIACTDTTITIQDPNFLDPITISIDEFKEKYPLVIIIDPENNKPIQLNKTATQLLKDFPKQILSKEGTNYINNALDVLFKDPQHADDILNMYQDAYKNNPAFQDTITKILSDVIQKNLGLSEEYALACAEFLSDPELASIIMKTIGDAYNNSNGRLDAAGIRALERAIDKNFDSIYAIVEKDLINIVSKETGIDVSYLLYKNQIIIKPIANILIDNELEVAEYQAQLLEDAELRAYNEEQKYIKSALKYARSLKSWSRIYSRKVGNLYEKYGYDSNNPKFKEQMDYLDRTYKTKIDALQERINNLYKVGAEVRKKSLEIFRHEAKDKVEERLREVHMQEGALLLLSAPLVLPLIN